MMIAELVVLEDHRILIPPSPFLCRPLFFALFICPVGKDGSSQHLPGRVSHGGAEHKEGFGDFLREPRDSVRSNAGPCTFDSLSQIGCRLETRTTMTTDDLRPFLCLLAFFVADRFRWRCSTRILPQEAQRGEKKARWRSVLRVCKRTVRIVFHTKIVRLFSLMSSRIESGNADASRAMLSYGIGLSDQSSTVSPLVPADCNPGIM